MSHSSICKAGALACLLQNICSQIYIYIEVSIIESYIYIYIHSYMVDSLITYIIILYVYILCIKRLWRITWLCLKMAPYPQRAIPIRKKPWFSHWLTHIWHIDNDYHMMNQWVSGAFPIFCQQPYIDTDSPHFFKGLQPDKADQSLLNMDESIITSSNIAIAMQ